MASCIVNLNGSIKTRLIFEQNGLQYIYELS